MDDIIAVHKQVERMLRRLTVIAERAREGVVVLALNGVVQFVNAAWAAMHGYKSTDDLVGKQISVFHTKEQMETDVTDFIEEAKQRGQFAGRLGHVRRDGTPFFAEMLMVVFNDEVGKAMGLVGFATDLTEQERTEDELRRYRCHLAELVKQQTEGLEAANALLQRQVTEYEQAGQQLKQQIAELLAANEQLREQICEHERAKDELERYRDELEQYLRKQSDELTAASEHLRTEIARRRQQEERLKQQTNAIKAAGARLQAQIDELSVGGPIGESNVSKAKNLAKAAASLPDDEKTVLENVFRQNIVLQKPKVESDTEEDL